MSRRHPYNNRDFPDREVWREPDWDEAERSRRQRAQWDRDHFERSMDVVRNNQRDPDESYGSLGGTPYEGGVYSSGTYGSGAEFYSVTGMYTNPLLEHSHGKHRGKGPRGYTRSDDRIHEEICVRLTEHPLIDASMMDVVVENGEVTLTGEVHDRRMKHMAEDVVDSVSGIRDIHNKLRVSRDKAA